MDEECGLPESQSPQDNAEIFVDRVVPREKGNDRGLARSQHLEFIENLLIRFAGEPLPEGRKSFSFIAVEEEDPPEVEIEG